jgi:hypothetical protein
MADDIKRQPDGGKRSMQVDLAEVPTNYHQRKPTLEQEFQVLAQQWLEETEYLSNLNKAILHPAYQQIIGMGKAAPDEIVRLILRELDHAPDHWLVALSEITGEDPAPDDADFHQAVEAWLDWGRKREYLTDS